MKGGRTLSGQDSDVAGSHTEASGCLKLESASSKTAGGGSPGGGCDSAGLVVASRDYRAFYQNAFQRRESLGNSDLRSVGVLSNITAWALADRDAKTSSS